MTEEYQILRAENRHIPIVPRVSGTLTEPKFVLTAMESLNVIETHREMIAKAYQLIRDGEARRVIVTGGSFQITVEETGTFRKNRSFQAIGNLSGLEIEK